MSDRPKLVMLVVEGCPHCKRAKEAFKDEIERGEIEVMDVYKDEGAMELASKLGINAVPTFVVKTPEGAACKVGDSGSVEACYIESEDKVCDVELEGDGRIRLVNCRPAPPGTSSQRGSSSSES